MKQQTADVFFLIVATSVALAGIGLFFTVAETDYHVEFDERHDALRPSETAAAYERLNPTQQQAFDRTVAGGVATYDEDIAYPDIVQYDGQYYYFSYYSTAEWTSLYTAGPAALALLGLGAIVVAVRRSMHNRIIY
ncbi:hypothetical protein [Haladaptatus sp. ZSTT2]|uniref:hypothetical protein n=1 Tax=Haladaptatus sp. ZSTT2 TaxID=3120515 RepID=UPI00300EB00D